MADAAALPARLGGRRWTAAQLGIDAEGCPSTADAQAELRTAVDEIFAAAGGVSETWREVVSRVAWKLSEFPPSTPVDFITSGDVREAEDPLAHAEVTAGAVAFVHPERLGSGITQGDQVSVVVSQASAINFKKHVHPKIEEVKPALVLSEVGLRAEEYTVDGEFPLGDSSRFGSTVVRTLTKLTQGGEVDSSYVSDRGDLGDGSRRSGLGIGLSISEDFSKAYTKLLQSVERSAGADDHASTTPGTQALNLTPRTHGKNTGSYVSQPVCRSCDTDDVTWDHEHDVCGSPPDDASDTSNDDDPDADSTANVSVLVRNNMGSGLERDSQLSSNASNLREARAWLASGVDRDVAERARAVLRESDGLITKECERMKRCAECGHHQQVSRWALAETCKECNAESLFGGWLPSRSPRETVVHGTVAAVEVRDREESSIVTIFARSTTAGTRGSGGVVVLYPACQPRDHSSFISPTASTVSSYASTSPLEEQLPLPPAASRAAPPGAPKSNHALIAGIMRATDVARETRCRILFLTLLRATHLPSVLAPAPGALHESDVYAHHAAACSAPPSQRSSPRPSPRPSPRHSHDASVGEDALDVTASSRNLSTLLPPPADLPAARPSREEPARSACPTEAANYEAVGAAGDAKGLLVYRGRYARHTVNDLLKHFQTRAQRAPADKRARGRSRGRDVVPLFHFLGRGRQVDVIARDVATATALSPPISPTRPLAGRGGGAAGGGRGKGHMRTSSSIWETHSATPSCCERSVESGTTNGSRLSIGDLSAVVPHFACERPPAYVPLEPSGGACSTATGGGAPTTSANGSTAAAGTTCVSLAIPPAGVAAPNGHGCSSVAPPPTLPCNGSSSNGGVDALGKEDVRSGPLLASDGDASTSPLSSPRVFSESSDTRARRRDHVSMTVTCRECGVQCYPPLAPHTDGCLLKLLDTAAGLSVEVPFFLNLVLLPHLAALPCGHSVADAVFRFVFDDPAGGFDAAAPSAGGSDGASASSPMARPARCIIIQSTPCVQYKVRSPPTKHASCAVADAADLEFLRKELVDFERCVEDGYADVAARIEDCLEALERKRKEASANTEAMLQKLSSLDKGAASQAQIIPTVLDDADCVMAYSCVTEGDALLVRSSPSSPTTRGATSPRVGQGFCNFDASDDSMSVRQGFGMGVLSPRGEALYHTPALTCSSAPQASTPSGQPPATPPLSAQSSAFGSLTPLRGGGGGGVGFGNDAKQKEPTGTVEDCRRWLQEARLQKAVFEADARRVGKACDELAPAPAETVPQYVSHLNDCRKKLLEELAAWGKTLGKACIPPSLQGVLPLATNRSAPFTCLARSEEFTSIIAHILGCASHRRALDLIGHEDGGDGSQRASDDSLYSILRSDKKGNISFTIAYGGTREIKCTAYSAKKFAALRQLLTSEQALLCSLSRCSGYSPEGGKSRASFFITQDRRYLAKEISSGQLQHFESIAHEYFKYVCDTLRGKIVSVLAKIVGVYAVSGAGCASDGRYWIVQENVFFPSLPINDDPSILSGVFDLKGAGNARRTASVSSRVKLDQDFMARMNDGCFVNVIPECAALLKRAVHNDTLFLSRCCIMDYSLLLLADGHGTLALGIIDYLQAFNTKKKAEATVKSWFEDDPTIIHPSKYKERFRAAVGNYLMLSAASDGGNGREQCTPKKEGSGSGSGSGRGGSTGRRAPTSSARGPPSSQRQGEGRFRRHTPSPAPQPYIPIPALVAQPAPFRAESFQAIAVWLAPRDVVTMSQCSRSWHAAARQCSLWSDIFRRDYPTTRLQLRPYETVMTAYFRHEHEQRAAKP